MTMRVLNRKSRDMPRDAIDIMRPGPLGNPFRIGRDGTRDEVVDKHMVWARQKIATERTFRQRVKELWGHDLICNCAPERCHGDNYIILCKELQ